MMREITDSQREQLAELALEAMGRAYAPYSGFCVGAAILTESGEIITGSNVENASYPAGSCAERTAAFYAASHGHRRFRAVAVAGGKKGQEAGYCAPCGICRQVLREFADPEELLVLLVKSRTDYKSFRLSELLPESFGPEMLGRE